MKYIVFDLDETIGHFVQLGYIHAAFENYLNRELSVYEKFFILDTFPNVFRPGIFKTFKHIIKEKKRQHVKVVLFTNNQGPPSWARLIIEYIHHKLNYQLFDKIIGAYKIKGVINEPLRTSDDKSYLDFKKIVNLNDNIPVLFFDDQIHYNMLHSNVSYILIEPYKKVYDIEEVITRIQLKVPIHNNKKFIELLNEYNNYFLQIMTPCIRYNNKQEKVINYHINHFLVLDTIED